MMRSIFFSSRFHSKVIKFFSVTLSAYQSPYSTLITSIYKHSAILELLINTKCQDVVVRYTQGYNGQGSDAPELMLNINMESSRDYAQHFQLSFHVFQSFSPNTKVSTHVLQSSSLNTIHQSLKCSRPPRSTQKHLVNHVLQVHAQHKEAYTYIINNKITPNIYKSNHHVHMQWGL